MKIGDYVRKKLKNGSLVGPYLQVQYISGNVIYCSFCLPDEDVPNLRFFKTNYEVVPSTSLCVSEICVKRLKAGEQFKVRHPITVKWKSAMERNVKIVTFYCVPKLYKQRFVVSDIYRDKDDIVIIVANKL